MNYIIFDLEATCWHGKPKSKTQEIIEIGAYLLDSYGEVKGSYNRFVRPILHPYLSSYCTDLTTIEQHQVDRASKFGKVIEEFQDWAEVFDEDYLLCSWGNFDKTMLIEDCRLHDIEEDWLDAHINLKSQYRDIKGLSRERGLKWAVEREGFEFSGIHHRAIADAENLAKIFIKYLDEWRT